MLKQKELEGFILEAMRRKLFTRKLIEKALKSLKKSGKLEEKDFQKARVALKVKIAKIETELRNLRNAIAQGISPASLAPAIESREKLKLEGENLLSRIAVERADSEGKKLKIVTPDVVDEVYHQMHAILNSADPRELRRFVRTYIKVIKVSGTDVTIDFNVKHVQSCQIMVPGVEHGYLVNLASIQPLSLLLSISVIARRCKTKRISATLV
jgi:hypothetical protein